MKIVGGVLLLCVAATLAAAQDTHCDREQARAEIQKLTDDRIIVSISQFLPYVTVVVDERRWARSDPGTQKAWAQSIACAALDPENPMFLTIVFRARDTTLLGTYSKKELSR
jgi:hypothetical protein